MGAAEKAIRVLRRSGQPVIGCFPLYPPLELFHSLGLTPVVLWGLDGSARDLPDADRHIQSYACSVARRLAQCVMEHGAQLFDGLFFYNACDTLRNLPEILREGCVGGGAPPMFRMHVPMTSTTGEAVRDYLAEQVEGLTRSLESHFGARFSEESFAASVTLYRRMRELASQLEHQVALGRMSFAEFCDTMVRANFLAVEQQIELLETCLGSLPEVIAGQEAGVPVLVSGILSPPPAIARLFDEAGLRVAGNDLASCFRAYAHTPQNWNGSCDYYLHFYQEHFPCTTLLPTANWRVPALLDLVAEREARGFIFLGEKYCEYEYFEMPYLQSRLEEAGIPLLSLEISIDDATNTETFRTRIQAFAEMLRERESMAAHGKERLHGT